MCTRAVSGLAHYFEDQGIATVCIALVPQHAKQMQPPRTISVPFELGRPLGVPGDPEFQTSVLRHALSLIEKSGPGPVFEEFDEDAPATNPDAVVDAWSCPVSFAPPPADVLDYAAALLEEIHLLHPWFEKGRKARGYTSTGTSGLDSAAIAAFLSAFVSQDPPQESPVTGQSLSDSLKLAVEDLKAYYYESADAQPGLSTSSDMAHWLWHETTAGKLIKSVSEACQSHADEMVKLVAAFTLVPVSEQQPEPSD